MRASDGSITDLGDGRKRIRLTAGYDPETGKQIRASRTIRGSKREAAEVLERLKREYGTAESVIYGRMSVYDFVKDEWLPTRKLRETTLRTYNGTLENHIQPAFGSVFRKRGATLNRSR
jgi:hypothetical protein